MASQQVLHFTILEFFNLFVRLFSLLNEEIGIPALVETIAHAKGVVCHYLNGHQNNRKTFLHLNLLKERDLPTLGEGTQWLQPNTKA